MHCVNGCFNHRIMCFSHWIMCFSHLIMCVSHCSMCFSHWIMYFLSTTAKMLATGLDSLSIVSSLSVHSCYVVKLLFIIGPFLHERQEMWLPPLANFSNVSAQFPLCFSPLGRGINSLWCSVVFQGIFVGLYGFILLNLEGGDRFLSACMCVNFASFVCFAYIWSSPWLVFIRFILLFLAAAASIWPSY